MTEIPARYRDPMAFVIELRARMTGEPPITQGQLARAAGMSASQLSRYLRFRAAPSVPTMDRVYTALTRLEQAGRE